MPSSYAALAAAEGGAASAAAALPGRLDRTTAGELSVEGVVAGLTCAARFSFAVSIRACVAGCVAAGTGAPTGSALVALPAVCTTSGVPAATDGPEDPRKCATPTAASATSAALATNHGSH